MIPVFYGCYLKDFVWTCKRFTSRKEANDFALSHREDCYATKLVPVMLMPDCLERRAVQGALSFAIRF